jgi:tetratricopeptide (TPR) repeat protein
MDRKEAKMSADRKSRERSAAGLAVAFVSLLMVSAVTTYVLWQRVLQERQVAATERARAQAAQSRAEKLSAFLMDSFAADPSHAPWKEITSREVFDQGMARMGEELSASDRKQYEVAQQRYREALAMYDRTLPPGHGFTAATALTMLGRTQLELGRSQEAEATLKLALQEWSKDRGVASPWYAHARAVRGRAWAVQRRFAEAEPALLETYPVLLRARLDDQLTTTVRGWIEDLYRETGRPQQAQVYFQQLQAQAPAISPDG